MDMEQQRLDAFERVNPYARYALTAIHLLREAAGPAGVDHRVADLAIAEAQVYATLAVAFDAWSRR